MAYASRAMRGLVIDNVRRRFAHKRGGQFEIMALETTVAERLPDADSLQEISDALDELAEFEAPLAEVVDLKFFCGFSFAEIAAMRGVSERTVQRQWEKARLFLHRTMSEGAKPSRTPPGGAPSARISTWRSIFRRRTATAGWRRSSRRSPR
jgi:RNA polymerase sigma factor (TIGR02999 family)